MRALPSLAVASLLTLNAAGCALFAPAFDKVLAEKSTAAYENVSKIAANIELGNYQDVASYKDASALYVDAQAQLSVASVRAATLPVSGRGTAADARSLLVRFIDGCSAQVRSLAQLHQTEGLQPGAGASQSMLTSCDQAARAARAMEVSQ